MKSHVLSVGHCSSDDYRLAHILEVEADAHLDPAHSLADARRMLADRPYDLVLVNRIVEGDGASGVDFIGEVKKVEGSPCVMLVSDYGDAQAAALANGAVAGFGKDALGTPEIGQRLRETLHSCSRAGNRDAIHRQPLAPPQKT